MKDILAPANLPVLDQLAWANVLLAFDYDGTLAPLVRNRELARMRPVTRRLLTRVAGVYPCTVISGRTRDETSRLVQGTGVSLVFGNHGLEPGPRPRATHRVRAWAAALRRELAPLRGVSLEDKALSLSIHYRRAPSRRRAREAILRAVSRLEGARVIGGKCAVNVVPRGAPHKGTALERARAQLGCDVALYVGDDETDEDVFGLDDPGRLVTVRVGPARTSRAAFYVRDQARMDELLARLLELRRRVPRKA